MNLRRNVTVVLIAITAMSTGGCAQTTQTPIQSVASATPLPLLALSPTPGLTATTVDVTPQSLQAEGTVKGVADELTFAGFVAGRQRTFQGPSKDLTLVRDREMVFQSPSGAQQYLNSVHEQAVAYFGEATGISDLKSGSRRGYLFVPPECACHGANPVLTAVLTDGPRLSWVTINGPMATKERLQQVLTATTRP